MKVLAVLSTLAGDVERLNRAIRSMRKHCAVYPFEILVVNNSGLPTIAGLDDVDHVYSPGVNLGYVGALEAARRRYPCDFLWSIQDDMTLQNDVLAVLITAMHASPRLGAASPVLVRSGVVPAWTRAGVFTNPERTRWENYPPVDTAPGDLSLDVDYSFVSGSGALFRSEALADIDGFNLDLYPLVHVDVDVCARMLANGWEIRLEPQAHIDHQVQGSTPRTLSRTLDKRNRVVVERQLASQAPNRLPTFDTVDTEVLFDVARRASFLFLEVSREADLQLAAAESRLNEVQLRLEALVAQRDGLAAERDGLAAERDWWHGQFSRLRGRRSVRYGLFVAGIVSRWRSSATRHSESGSLKADD